MEKSNTANIENEIILKDNYRSGTSLGGTIIISGFIAFAISDHGKNETVFSITWVIFAVFGLYLIARQKRDWVFTVSLDGAWKLTVKRLFKSINITGTSKDIKSIEIIDCDYGEITLSYIVIEVVERGHFWIKSNDDDDLFYNSIGFVGAANKLNVIFGLPNAVKESSCNSRDGDVLFQLT
jgi:hypothetical protein